MNPRSACEGSQLFTGNQCNAVGIGCFIGMKPSVAQINQCSDAVVDTAFGPTELDRKRLAVAALALVFLTRPRREPDGAGGTSRIPAVILSAVTVLLAVAAAYYVVRAGHTGATAVWS